MRIIEINYNNIHPMDLPPSPVTSRRINLWSSPRNISTALMYAFAQREDTTVVDEPLYAHYLLHQPTTAEHPGRETILASQENDGEKVVREMLTRDYKTKAVVFKQMTHHLIKLNHDFLSETHNIILIRDPRAIVTSFSKVVDRVVAEDIGIPQQHRLFQELSDSGHLTAVVDAHRLLLDPPTVLAALCDRLGLPFTPEMLRWPAGPRPEDGVWAPHWYTSVHNSTGFQPHEEKSYHLTASLAEIAENCRPAYEELLAEAL
jgi:hypothetical protein